MVKKILAVTAACRRPRRNRRGRLGAVDSGHRDGAHAIASQVSSLIGQPATIGGIGHPSSRVSHRPRAGDDWPAAAHPRRDTSRRNQLPGPSLPACRARHAAACESAHRAAIAGLWRRNQSNAPGRDAAGSAPIEIVSIDEIELRDVELVSGARTLRGDIDAAIEGQGIVLRSMSSRPTTRRSRPAAASPTCPGQRES